jgi:hypothetical protein
MKSRCSKLLAALVGDPRPGQKVSCFMVRVLTQAEYQAIVNRGMDYCECCGGKYSIDGLIENAMMPDEEGSLQGGYTVCHPCSQHAENGPCKPGSLVIVRAPESLENEQAVQCAVEQAPQEMPHIEVIEASLYKKVELFGEQSELSVGGVRWYVEVEVRNLNDATIAMVLYRVWRADTGEWKATWVPSV